MTLARSAVAGVVLALASVATSPTFAAAAPDATAQAWYGGVINDLHPLQSTLLGALNAASGWTAGSESATAARNEFAKDLPELERVHHALAKLAPLKGHATALHDYVSGVELYIDSLQIDQAATKVTPGALREQLQHSSQRVRELGDVVFDQGTAELTLLLGSRVAGPDVAAASHVPDWSAIGLAPGPPLAPTWPAAGTVSTASEPKAAWVAEVTRGGAPSQKKLRAALAGRLGVQRLAQMAVALGSAEAYVSSVPRPDGDAQRSNRLRLGLLVDAEAVMTAAAGDLSSGAPAHPLTVVARSLGLIGGQLRAEG